MFRFFLLTHAEVLSFHLKSLPAGAVRHSLKTGAPRSTLTLGRVQRIFGHLDEVQRDGEEAFEAYAENKTPWSLSRFLVLRSGPKPDHFGRCHSASLKPTSTDSIPSRLLSMLFEQGLARVFGPCCADRRFHVLHLLRRGQCGR